MRLNKRLLSGLCATVMALSLSAPAQGYVDVPEHFWNYKDIQAVTDTGLMNGGYSDQFHPMDTVTRGTIITVLWRLDGSPAAEIDTPFPDIAAKNWAYTAGQWAKEAGVATGYSDGRFSPNDPVTREQLAVFLQRYAVYKGEDVAEGVVDLYADAAYISPWALPGMKHALGAGLMTGTTNGLSPLGLASRAELATILVRLTTPVQG